MWFTIYYSKVKTTPSVIDLYDFDEGPEYEAESKGVLTMKLRADPEHKSLDIGDVVKDDRDKYFIFDNLGLWSQVEVK